MGCSYSSERVRYTPLYGLLIAERHLLVGYAEREKLIWKMGGILQVYSWSLGAKALRRFGC